MINPFVEFDALLTPTWWRPCYRIQQHYVIANDTIASNNLYMFNYSKNTMKLADTQYHVILIMQLLCKCFLCIHCRLATMLTLFIPKSAKRYSTVVSPLQQQQGRHWRILFINLTFRLSAKSMCVYRCFQNYIFLTKIGI